MSDLYERLVVQRVKPSGKVYDERPVEPVGTITVDASQFITDGPLWVETQTTLPPGEYLIVPKEADDE